MNADLVKASKYMKQNPTELKWELNTSRDISGDFNSPFSKIDGI